MIDFEDPVPYALNEIPKTTGATQSDNFNINVLDALKAIYDLLVGVAEFVNAEDATGPLFKPGAGLDFVIQLADAAGARKVQVKDSGGTVVFEIDSDGVVSISKRPSATKTANYTTVVSDGMIFCDASGGAFTIMLITAIGNNGLEYSIARVDESANAVTVDGDGSETINKQLTIVLGPLDAIRIGSDGSNWSIL